MSKADIHLVDETDEIERQFRSVMRRLAGGVAVITAGRGEDITGMTVTSLTSLSASPPRLLVSINRQASSFGPDRAIPDVRRQHSRFGTTDDRRPLQQRPAERQAAL